MKTVPFMTNLSNINKRASEEFGNNKIYGGASSTGGSGGSTSKFENVAPITESDIRTFIKVIDRLFDQRK